MTPYLRVCVGGVTFSGVIVGTSWSHLLVRPLARPLIRLGVTPNQITALHLIVGLITVAAIAWGTPAAEIGAGFGWLFACLLDRLDGEVARIGDMCTPAGHKFDCFVDTTLSSLYFLGLGVGLRDAPQPFGWIAVACGVIACASQLTLSQVAEDFDSQSDDGKILASRWGFDADDANVFRNTLRMLDWIRIDAIQLAILTPLPGTVLYESMEPRIIDRNWEHYDFRHAVFEPRHMSATDLQAGADWIIRRFYSPWRILRRVPRWAAVPGGLRHCLYILALNLAYYGRVRRFHIEGQDPAKPATGATHRAGKKSLRAA